MAARGPLVVVSLRGGMDGLSILVPAGDPAYHAARPSLAVDDKKVLPADTRFGWHPSAPRLAELFRAGMVAAVPASGIAGQLRSHFVAQAQLEAGGTAAATAGSGWLGRYLAATEGAEPAPLRAVSVGTIALPRSLYGTGDAMAVTNPGMLRLGTIDKQRVLPAKFVPDTARLATAWTGARPQAAAVGAQAALKVLQRVTATPIRSPELEQFRGTPKGAFFEFTTAFLEAGLGTELINIDFSGWDTHSEQGTNDGILQRAIAELDTDIGYLVDRHVGKGAGLTILVITEFGRRVAENSSRGTDHGRGGLAMLIGDHVAGGVAGHWPGLVDLDNGDVQAVNDVRQLQAEVLTDLLGVADTEVAKILPGHQSETRLGLFKA